MWLGRLESVIICAEYGPEPEVIDPAVLGDSVPSALGGNWAVYVERADRGMQKIPPALTSSPVAGKFPGLGTN